MKNSKKIMLCIAVITPQLSFTIDKKVSYIKPSKRFSEGKPSDQIIICSKDGTTCRVCSPNGTNCRTYKLQPPHDRPNKKPK